MPQPRRAGSCEIEEQERTGRPVVKTGTHAPPPAGLRLVVVESPYAGDVEANLAYARAAVADCLARGEAPIASHLLYTQDGVLDDDDPAQRRLGINAGLAWYRVAHGVVVYTDLGVSAGMRDAISHAEEVGIEPEFRTLG